MVRTEEQAKRIQLQRVRDGKRGVAKAVQRWARRTHQGAFVSGLPRNKAKAEELEG